MSHTATCERDDHVDGDAEQQHAGRPGTSPATSRHAVAGAFRRRLWSLREVRWAFVALSAFLLAIGAGLVTAERSLQVVLLVVCYGAGGWEPTLEGLRALRQRRLDVDLLMIVAALVAAAIGEAVDGALLIVIFASSGALEAAATTRTKDAVASLLTLAPERATLVTNGEEIEVEARDVEAGDVLLVRPGERVGGDGIVIEGASEVDESTMTGEPLPTSKAVGDPVLAGTLNGTGALRVRVEKSGAESVIARVVTMVAEASETKATTQLFIERVEQRYSVGVVAGTVALLIVPLLAGSDLEPTLLRAMTFMIVASPCALVLATMPPLLSAIANAGRHGVLIKSAVVMEQLGHTEVVGFDKTGTLTEGMPLLADVHTSPGARFGRAELLALAAAAELHSEHPVGRAIVLAALQRNLKVGRPRQFESRPGFGVTALVDGHEVEVRRTEARREGQASAVDLYIEEVQRAGRTAVVVTIDGVVEGVLGLSDRLRPAAAATVAQLAGLTGSRPVLLTGDNDGAARQVADQVGITEVRARLLPDEKVAAVRALAAGGRYVMMVGDGVNDAPALAAASIGVAVGRRGSDLALETADVIIVGDDLTKVPVAIELSRQARRVVNQNLAIACTVIFVLVLIDLFGHLPLAVGVAGHEGSTVLVGLNGLRLLSRRCWERGPRG